MYKKQIIFKMKQIIAYMYRNKLSHMLKMAEKSLRELFARALKIF